MLIEYTSAREHRPSAVGANLAPSMVYTNWTAGNNAQRGNDAAGNLTVTYNGTANPYVYADVAVTANAVYRLRYNIIGDGVSRKAFVYAAITTGGSSLHSDQPIDDVNVTTPGEVFIKSPSTNINVSLGCSTSTATHYAKFSDVRLELVSIMTHAPDVALTSPRLVSVNQYTGVNSTLSMTSMFGLSTYGDNAVVITNTGAAYGEARRTYSFPTVAGRRYKASAVWLPHEAAQGTINVGTTYGGAEYGYGQLLADIDNVAPFFTVGTDSSGNALRWNFNNSNDGWARVNCNEALSATYIGLTATATDPVFRKIGLSFSGYQNRYVIAWMRRTSASWANEMVLYYQTAAHGETGSYYGYYNGLVPVQVASGSGARTMIVWDMWQLQSGGDDWKNSTITGIRPDFTNTNGATWEIDLIAVGNINPLEMEFTATGDTAYLRLYNSAENNGVSYYLLPHVVQLDSLYTLEQAGSAASQPNRRKIGGRNISEDGVNEWGYIHRIEKHWEIVTDEVEGTAYDDWNEFLESVSNSEVFTIDVKGTAASPNDPRLAVLADDSWDSPRINNVDKWRFRFRVRFLPR